MTIPQLFSIAGTRAFVLGATTPRGRAIALGLAGAGADVCVASLTEDATEGESIASVAHDITGMGRKGRGYVIDATGATQISDVVQKAAMEMGGLTLLVNNTDYPVHRPALEISPAEWNRAVALNAGAALFASQAVAEQMLAGGGGRIINITSILGERGIANNGAYGPTKAAVTNLTRSLGIEWAPLGIRVNGIAIGWEEGSPSLPGDERTKDRLRRFVPAQRFATAEEIVGLVLYLASPAADYMQGEVIFVDGGALTHI